MTCAKRVRDALAKLDGVEKVQVDLSRAAAYLTLKDGLALDKEATRQALPSGYGLTALVKLER